MGTINHEIIRPQVLQGYYGAIKIDDPTTDWDGSPLTENQKFIKAANIGLTPKQSIDPITTLDGRFDNTVYKVGPLEIEGNVSFPAVHSGIANGGMIRYLWNAAMVRDITTGRLRYNPDIFVKYAADTNTFKYERCGINTFGMSIAQQDVLNIDMGLIGSSRLKDTETKLRPSYGTRNERAVTWNDCLVGIRLGDSSLTNASVASAYIREFKIDINNGTQRYYSLNGQLSPVDIAPTKREIGGTIQTLGRVENLSDYAYRQTVTGGIANAEYEGTARRCSELAGIVFGFGVSKDQIVARWTDGSNSGDTLACAGGFYVYIPGTAFSIEEMSLTSDIFTTNINWKAMPGAAQTKIVNGVETLDLDGYTYDIAPPSSVWSNGGMITNDKQWDIQTFRYTGNVSISQSGQLTFSVN